MSISIKDIAKAAGVSHSTVSRALRHSPLISDKTGRRMRGLAEEMGYVPNAIARGLVTKSTRTIGLVVTTIADPFVADIAGGVEELALEHGYSVFLCNSNAQPHREIAAVKTLRENRVDGVIVTSSRVGDLYLPLLEEMKVPIVLINNQRNGQYVWSVATDNIHGGRLATDYLIELGHKRIGYIGGWSQASSSRDRLRGYKRALKAHRIPFDSQLVSRGNGRMEGGQEWGRKLLSLPHPPTAIFCYNDMTAIGALMALREANLRVPEDLSVVGFDDIALAAYVEPPLTTIAQSKHEMGRLAMGMLLDLLSGKESVSNIVLKGELIVRASCRQIDKN